MLVETSRGVSNTQYTVHSPFQETVIQLHLAPKYTIFFLYLPTPFISLHPLFGS